MDFKNDRFITKGVDFAVSPLLQLFMWHLIDAMLPPKDYLHSRQHGTLVYDRFNYIDYGGFNSCRWWNYPTGK